MSFSFGDILVINFPFSDGQGAKRRPVMVVKDTQDEDLLVAKITSQPYKTDFDVVLQYWRQANLTSPSVIRVHKIQTIYSKLVFGQIGRLAANDLSVVKKILFELANSL